MLAATCAPIRHPVNRAWLEPMRPMRGRRPIAPELAGLTWILPTMLFRQPVMSRLPGAETSVMSVLCTA
jgi:hypothetical protein